MLRLKSGDLALAVGVGEFLGVWKLKKRLVGPRGVLGLVW